MKEYLEAVKRFARAASVPLQRVQTLLGNDQVSISTVKHSRVIFLSWRENSLWGENENWMVSFVENNDASIEHFTSIDAAIEYIARTIHNSDALVAF